MVLEYLRADTRSATRDLGEDQSIAFCMAEAPDAVFVTMDKRAAFVALSELGPGRVATAFDFWRWMQTEALITHLECDALCNAALRQDSGLPGLPKRLGW